MSQQATTRFALDLDDLERQLRTTASAQPKAPLADPLAELARIVGQDDPFRKLKAARTEPEPAPLARSAEMAKPATIEDLLSDAGHADTDHARRIEPNFDHLIDDFEKSLVQSEEARLRNGVGQTSKVDPMDDPLGEFDDLLRSELRSSLEATQATGDAADEAPVGSEPSAPASPSATAAVLASTPVAASLPAAAKLADRGTPLPSGYAPDVDERIDPPKDLDFADPPPADARYVPPPPADYPEPPADNDEDLRALEPASGPKRGLAIAGALLLVGVLGIGTVVTLRGSGSNSTGGIPVVRADTSPTKVAPENPGGVEIPNQNKEIYERQQPAQAQPTRVVTREEQPIDVQAVARVTPRVIPLSPTAEAPASAQAETPAAPAAPSANGAAPAAAPLGEPRRVRTVAVRPDGTIAAPASTGSATPAPAPAAQTPATTPAPQRPQAASSAPTPQPPRPPVAAARPTEEARATPPTLQRTQVAAAPATQPAPQATSPRTDASRTGGFMIQLGAPGSEAEARALFGSLQRRHSEQLASEQAVIRRAELAGGRTVFRLRVGPFSREEAAERCRSIQASGGQCFIASN